MNAAGPTPSYRVARFVLAGLTKTLWRLRVSGREYVPARGPLIVAANHLSYLDPPVLGVACPRALAYMAKEELFRVPILGPMIRSFGAYPVDRRGSAASAIKRSLEVLEAGGAVGIFPEGTRNRDGSARPQEGLALLASWSGAPVVPAAIVGTDRALRFPRFVVVFGEPLALPVGRKATREELAKFTMGVMGAIRALAEKARGDT
jgi:1-acyl-sn-glycerol-3-phosphate acyltransferase